MGKRNAESPVQVTVVNRATGRVRTLTAEENDQDDTGNASSKGQHRLRNNTDPKE